MAEGMGRGDWDAFYSVKENQYLGTEAFIEGVKGPAPQSSVPKNQSLKKIKDLNAFAREVAAIFGGRGSPKV